MADLNPTQGLSADDVFADYERRCEGGERVDFEALCRAHPELAPALRKHEAARQLLARSVPGPLVTDGEEKAARNKRATASTPDDDASIGIDASGDDDTDAGSPSELLGRLRDQGQRGSRYRVLGEIARGGMGVVLRVLDTELRRKLAMKVALAKDEKLSDSTPRTAPESIGRFLEEAQVTSQLDHPGIVPVHEIGVGADGRVFFTMRLVRGDNLRTIFARVRDGVDGWSQERAVGVLLKVCEAMSYAHEKKVIHRDLKPANVMVGRFGEVYVMDWGLARVLGRQDRHDLRIRPQPEDAASALDTERQAERETTPDSPLVTMDGQILGTPAYMSPEQAKGQVDKLGPQSDVYALGAMLYHLISGQMPYVPAEARLSGEAIRWRVVEGPPRPLHELGRTAPAPLVAICEKAMAREIEQRYPDMRSLASDLRAYVEGRTVAAYATGTWAETRMWVRRNRALASAIAAAALTLAIAVVLSVGSAAKEKEAERRNAVRIRLDELQVLQRLGSDVDALARQNAGSATDWWLGFAHRLVHGDAEDRLHNPGLADVEGWLNAFRTQCGRQTRSPDYPRAAELRFKVAVLAWYSRMLEKSWPKEPSIDEARAFAGLAPAVALEQLTNKDWANEVSTINKHAWALVDPRNPQFGAEQYAYVLATNAVESVARARTDRAGREVLAKALANCSHTLAWACYRVGRFDQAQQLYTSLKKEPGAKEVIWGFNHEVPSLDHEILHWHDGTAASIRAELAAEVEALRQEAMAWTVWVFDDPRDGLWHDQLCNLHTQLVQLSRRLAVAETAYAHRDWPEAIAKIEAEYGRSIPVQLDLVPLGDDPQSKLWEFAHLPSGEPAYRRDGKLQLQWNTGMVFVLLRGGPVPLDTAPCGDKDCPTQFPRTPRTAETCFVSKYEMTRYQWARLRTTWDPRYSVGGSVRIPMSGESPADCAATLRGAGGWLALPGRDLWDYACRGGTTSHWWTGATSDSLRGRENLDFDMETHFALPVGSLGANPFGLHDVLGNVAELCADIVSQYRGDGQTTYRAITQAYSGLSAGERITTCPWKTNECSVKERSISVGLRPMRPLMP